MPPSKRKTNAKANGEKAPQVQAARARAASGDAAGQAGDAAAEMNPHERSPQYELLADATNVVVPVRFALC